jgi:predicted DNA-binding WGR domain protein
MLKPVFLINTEGNHYKFYDMHDLGTGRFKVEYGRIDKTRVEYEYPISKWSTKYFEKVRKGYVDVSQGNVSIGTVARTPDNKLAVVVGQRKGAGRGGISVETEHGDRVDYYLDDLSLTNMALEGALHQMFYPHLCTLYTSYTGR